MVNVVVFFRVYFDKQPSSYHEIRKIFNKLKVKPKTIRRAADEDVPSTPTEFTRCHSFQDRRSFITT